MSSRERQLWTEFVRKREGCKDDKPARKRRPTKPQPTPAKLEAALDDLVTEAERRTAASSTAPASDTGTASGERSAGWRRSPCSPGLSGTRVGGGRGNGCRSV